MNDHLWQKVVGTRFSTSMLIFFQHISCPILMLREIRGAFDKQLSVIKKKVDDCFCKGFPVRLWNLNRANISHTGD